MKNEAEVKELIEELTQNLTELAPKIKQAVQGYLDLPYSKRKELVPALQKLKDAGGLVVKALGTEWWKKWGYIVFGWIIGGFLVLAMVLGIFKIFFE